MRQTVKEGKTLLVDGPASVSLLSGSATVLGTDLDLGSKTVVRNGKRLPFEVLKNAAFELTLGESSSFMEMDGSTIPDCWKDAADAILASEGFVSTLVIGGVDSGKTSLCTFLANVALKEKRKVAVIDGDLGQSDLGPPATVGLARVATPIVDLYGAQAENIVFVGATTPSKAFNASLNALKTLKKESNEMNIDFLIINTDGWVEAEEAINHKNEIVRLFAPTAIIAIQEGDELKPLLDALRGFRIFVVESPKTVRKRSHETRKALRELAYRKHLKDARFQCYPLSWIEIKGTNIETMDAFGSSEKGIDRNFPQASPIWYDEPNASVIVEDARNRIVGLEDEKEKFLGIGILCSINLEKRIVKVYTSISERAKIIRVGQIRLDKSGKEIVS